MEIEIPGYVILRKIGSGGMATVYLAHQLNFDEDVALKIMDVALLKDPQFGERFINEARITRKFHHQNLVFIHDVGKHKDFYYIAMEYLSGGDLSQRLKVGISLLDTYHIMADLCSALDYAHNMGFVHRDLKPANIMFRDDGTTVLTDFGIAKNLRVASGLTVTGSMIGTPSYMSPEQARGEDLDHRSDYYSLTVIFFELLTGKVPYSGDSAMSIAMHHVTDPVPTLPDEQKEFQPFVNKGMAKAPEDRFQNGKEFIYSLYNIVLPSEHDDETVVRPPYSLSGEYPATSVKSGIAESEIQSPSLEPLVKPKKSLGKAIGPDISDTGPEKSPPDIDSRAPFPSLHGFKKSWLLLGGGTVAVLATVLVIQKEILKDGGDVSDKLVSVSSISMKIAGSLDESIKALEEGRLSDAESGFRSVLVFDINNETARKGLREVGGKYLDRASQAFTNSEIEKAQENLSNALRVDPDHPRLPKLQREIQAYVYSQERAAEERRKVEKEIATNISNAVLAMKEDRRISPKDNNAYDYYQLVLASDPDNITARDGIADIGRYYINLASDSISNRKYDEANTYIKVASQISPNLPELIKVQDKLNDAIRADETRKEKIAREAKEKAEIEELLNAALRDVGAGRLDLPAENNALDKYQRILEIDNKNERAKNGILEIGKRYMSSFEYALQLGQLNNAEDHLRSVLKYFPDHPNIARAKKKLQDAKYDLERKQIQAEKISKIIENAQRAVDSGKLDEAYNQYQQVLELQSDHESARSGIQKIATLYVEHAYREIDAHRFNIALEIFEKIIAIMPNNPKIPELQDKLKFEKSRQEVDGLIDKAEQSLAAGNLEDAFEQYRKILLMQPYDPSALRGIEDVASRYVKLIKLDLGTSRINEAQGNLENLKKIDPNHTQLENLQIRIKKESLKQEIESLLVKAAQLIKTGNLEATYLVCQEILSLDENNSEARSWITYIANQYAELALKEIDNKNFKAASSYLDRIKKISPENTQLEKLNARLKIDSDQSKKVEQSITIQDKDNISEIQHLLTKAEKAFKSSRITSPSGKSAYDYYRAVLNLDNNNQEAKSALEKISLYYVTAVKKELKKLEPEKAEANLKVLKKIDPFNPELNSLYGSLDLVKNELREQTRKENNVLDLLNNIDKHLSEKPLSKVNVDTAYEYYRELMTVSPADQRIQKALENIIQAYIDIARDKYKKNEFDEALNTVEQGLRVTNQNNNELRSLKNEIQNAKENSKKKVRIIPRF